MYAVIFKAEFSNPSVVKDDEYGQMATQLRDIAINQYGCLNFISSNEGDQEIAISYWPSLEAISLWKQNDVHLKAQQYGKQRWYKHYSIEIVEVVRHYKSV